MRPVSFPVEVMVYNEIKSGRMIRMKRLSYILGILLLTGIMASGCQAGTPEEKDDMTSTQAVKIDAEKAKKMMEEEVIVVDVRTEEEYSEAHIEGALLLTLDQIDSQAEKVIPDKDKTYLIYCRSGSRSSQAAEQLVGMGYTDIYDFGGIIDWPYNTVSGSN